MTNAIAEQDNHMSNRWLLAWLVATLVMELMIVSTPAPSLAAGRLFIWDHSSPAWLFQSEFFHWAPTSLAEGTIQALWLGSGVPMAWAIVQRFRMGGRTSLAQMAALGYAASLFGLVYLTRAGAYYF